MIIFSTFLNAQNVGDYRTSGNGNWTNPSIWQLYNGTSWVPALNYPDSTVTGIITIESGDTVIFVDISPDTLVLQNSTIIVNGYLKSLTAVKKLTSSTWVINGTYEHAYRADSVTIHGIPTATWNNGSTCIVTGITNSTTGLNSNQNFYNFIWDCKNQSGNLNAMWRGNTIYGDVIVRSTGNIGNTIIRAFRFTSASESDSATNPNIITINGNLIIQNNSFVTATGSGSPTHYLRIYLNGDLIYENNTTDTSSFQLANGSAGQVNWYVKGNIYLKPNGMGSFHTHSSTALPDSLFFTGSQRQEFLKYGKLSAANIRYRVITGAIVDMDTSNTGTSLNSTFTLENGATLISAHSNGLDGNIRVGGEKTLSRFANYIFSGKQPQVTGTLLPDVLDGNLTIDNNYDVTLVKHLNINGNVSVIKGDFILGNKILDLGTIGTLNETSGNTCIGTVTATRNLIANVEEDFGNIGLSINSSVAPGNTNVIRVTGEALQGAGSSSSILRYFDIEPAFNTDLNATVTFKYDVSELNGQNPATMQMYKRSAENTHWILQPATNFPGEHKLVATGLNYLSRTTAADSNNPFILTFNVAGGWNMVSVPVKAPDYRKTVLFPTASSNAFTFQGGYVVKDILENGAGYWVKFPSATIVGIPGDHINSDSISVNAGWNMIGSISIPLSTTNVIPGPGVTIQSKFYEYQAGYKEVDILQPGKAYWVKTSAPGKLYLNVLKK